MFDPNPSITFMLAILPVVGLCLLAFKCYVLVTYRRIWNEEDIFKLFPTTMILNIVELILHEVPELILIYFFQTRLIL